MVAIPSTVRVYINQVEPSYTVLGHLRVYRGHGGETSRSVPVQIDVFWYRVRNGPRLGPEKGQDLTGLGLVQKGPREVTGEKNVHRRGSN